MIRVIDVFSGIGGFSLGLESTGGFETVAFCEIEPFPREVLAVHWPEVPCFTDVRELKLSPGDADMIVGGFPCQDISVAGKGAGIEGERSGLWRELYRIVCECRPRWVLVENVPALRTRGADRVLTDMEEAGYTCWPLVVGAWAVGAPHRRERVWIVARALDASALGDPARSGQLRAQPAVDDREDGDRRDQGRQDPDAARSRGGVGEPTGAGLEGQRADAGQPQEPQPGDAGTYGLDLSEAIAGGVVARLLGTDAGIRGGTRHHAGNVVTGDATVAESEGKRRAQQGHGRYARSRLGCDGPRWPARPGEPQHEWEESRLAFAGSTDAAGRTSLGGRRGRTSNAQGHGTGAGDVSRSPQQPLGSAAHGLPERLARRANREALKALGNSVVPRVVAAIGRAILRVERG